MIINGRDCEEHVTHVGQKRLFSLRKIYGILIHIMHGVNCYLDQNILSIFYCHFIIQIYSIFLLEIDACDNTIDVVFLLDSSGSLTPTEFQQSKDFVGTVADSFLKPNVGSRVGLIQFSIVATVNAWLSDRLSYVGFRRILSQVRYQGGFTRLDRALSLAAEKFANEDVSESHIPKVLIVLTDGVNTDAPDAVAFDTAVAPLHQAGVRVFVVSTGDAKGRENLYLLTQREEDLYDVRNYDDMSLQLRRLSQDSCESGGKSLFTNSYR